jgi:ATP-binding cassette subfamily B protein RaxB
LRYGPLRDLSNESLIVGSEASSQFMETIRGIATVKQFGLELERMNQWQNRFVAVTNTGIRISRLNLGFGIANQLLFGIGNVVIVYIGARMVMEHTFTVGMLMAFSSYQQQFVGAGASLIDKWIALKLVDLHLDRLGDIALTKPEEESRIPVGPIDATYGGEIAMKNLRFAYSQTVPTVISGLDLTIAPGEFVAIVGPSGCGKSTLMRLMQGLEQPSEGVVCFGGVDIRRLGLGNYRAQVASVTQEDRLLSGSVAENITLFDPKIDQAWMVECAKRCMIHDSIMAMPMNYHSLIGDMGDALSAGERQRLMLARALYRRPSVLFLDEATCHMDPALDAKIMEMLARLSVTRVVVTHRSTPIKYAHRALELADGRLCKMTPRLAAVS